MLQNNLTKTACAQKKEANDLLMYKKRKTLRAIPGAKMGLVDKAIMEEFGIYTTAGLYGICKRVEKRLAEAETV